MTNRLGHVRVVWINSRDTFATPRYTARFACYEQPEELGAQKPKDIVGEAELLRFLQLFNLDAEISNSRCVAMSHSFPHQQQGSESEGDECQGTRFRRGYDRCGDCEDAR